MSESEEQEPEPVDDGCPLIPWVPRALCASILVKRIVEMEGGVRAPITLPVAFTKDDDEIKLAKLAGGGLFVAQARGANGSFLKGYKARSILIDGPMKEVGSVGSGNGEVVPPAPPPAAPPPGPVAMAGTGIPVASPLPGMPGVMMDVPGLSPQERAWIGRFDVMLSQVSYAHQVAANGRVTSAERYADAEREVAKNGVELAKLFVEKVSGPSLEKQGRAVEVIGEALKGEREAHATTRAELASVRAELAKAERTAAVYKVVLETGGRIESGKVPGLGGMFERLLGLFITTVGPGALALASAQLGVDVETLRALTSAVQAGETRTGELPASSSPSVRAP